jgi:hypothetical protein
MMTRMRTTVTLDPDVADLIDALRRERGISFKAAINEAIRAGLKSRPARSFRQRSFSMGFRPEINYDHALQLANALDNQETLHKLAVGN